ncbi:MATE family efflux transporter [uncultured Bacteroides sp.]|uniref:MATE family efflux transporter n=1 Tax=uncultured Bacteroides sp. TaxID=162156 RepID=UPI002620ECB8|nr:MATE family efflux transporter [uncultured Bacteroides sp.]
MKNSSLSNDLTQGSITGTMLRFAIPMIAGNLLQQCYNIADTLIVGQFLGADALAAVGSAYTLMVFITSIFIGLCMGSGAVFSLQYGAKDFHALKRSLSASLMLIGGITIVLNIVVLAGIHPIIRLLQTPAEIEDMMFDYLFIIFLGIISTFLYNYYAYLLRAVGNSVVPLVFLAISVVLNIGLDLLFILVFDWGVKGAAAATVISQTIAGVTLCGYTLLRFPLFRLKRCQLKWDVTAMKEIATYSSLTCMQQSVMNFGILMVQGLVNSFGTCVMAAFAVAVKIDSFAYMPVQDFGNAFSTFIAQNFGANERMRIKRGIRSAIWVTTLFCIFISVLVFVFAPELMRLFVDADETEIIGIGVEYLRVEGTFYVGIGYLFLLYGFYRAIRKPGMSVVLTVFSLGTRVALAYGLAAIPAIGVHGIWWSIPIGWFLADLFGWWYYQKRIIISTTNLSCSDSFANDRSS